MLCAELYDYNIFLISTTLGDFWRKFDITILVHPYTTSIKPYFRILHQLPLSKLCCITWGLLELSKPDLSFTYWQISSGQASNCFIWDWTYQPTRFIFRSLIWALVRKGGQGRAKQQPRCTKQVHTCIVGSSYMRDPPPRMHSMHVQLGQPKSDSLTIIIISKVNYVFSLFHFFFVLFLSGKPCYFS